MSSKLVGVATWKAQNQFRSALSATWPSIIDSADGWDDPTRLWDAGTLPFMHPMFKYRTTGGGQVIDEILGGYFDDEINDYYDSIVAYVATGRKMVLVPLPEMNGIWTAYGPVKSKPLSLNYANGRAVYRKMVDMARAKGLNKESGVLYCWAPNDIGWGKLAPYWPGDEYVDIVGGSCYNNFDTSWETVEQAIGPHVARVRQLTAKPIVITQTGSYHGDSRTPGWLDDLVEYTKTADIEGFIWFDIVNYEYKPGGPSEFNRQTASLSAEPPLHWFEPSVIEPPTEPLPTALAYLEVSYGDGMGDKADMAPAVSAWQGTLKALGRPDGNSQSPDGVDGKFGSGTRAATERLQGDLLLPQSGKADQLTRWTAERAKL